MKRILVVATLAISTFLHVDVVAQNRVATDVSDETLLRLYKGARVTDVVDGLVTVGLMDVGVMKPEIAPLWRDVSNMAHRMAGIAVTVRYGPTNKPRNPGADLSNPANYQTYRDWRGMWYSQLSTEPFQQHLKPGTVIVIDNRDDNDTGSTGSKNIMEWQQKGAVGVVSAGGIRDIDEIILQRNPVYTNYERRGRGERIGRNEVIDVQRPVVVGGVTVYPGDVVVGDSDGIVVVPRRVAVRVGQIAYQELADDIRGRRELYQKLGRPLDATVQFVEPRVLFQQLGLPLDPNAPPPAARR